MITWEELEEAVNKCHSCGLCRERHNAVFGVGDKTSPIMFVGEGPGYYEDMQGELQGSCLTKCLGQ